MMPRVVENAVWRLYGCPRVGAVVVSDKPLQSAIAAIPEGDAVRRRKNVYGVRNLFDVSPETRELARRAATLARRKFLEGLQPFAHERLGRY